MVRPPCCDKLNVKKGHWTEEEDAKVLAYVPKHRTGNWTAVPKKAGLRRCGKSCRLRWTNYPRPDLRHENFTSQEEELIIRLHSAIGSRWSIIAQQLPGRTDNDVKNYWNTKLRKKLSEMGIDPVTHKPFSQILADYGNINGGGLPKSAATRIGSLNRDSRNAFPLKPEQEGYPNPAMEYPIQNSFLNKHSSLDLLAQLQAITLVTTTAETKTPHRDHCFPASSSSSSSSSSSNFSWQDFLLEEPFLLPSDAQEENVGQNEMVLLQSGPKQEDQITEQNFSGVEEMSCDYSINGFEPPSSNSGSSFVEVMLDRQNEMLSEEFPSGLLEEPFLY